MGSAPSGASLLTIGVAARLCPGQDEGAACGVVSSAKGFTASVGGRADTAVPRDVVAGPGGEYGVNIPNSKLGIRLFLSLQAAKHGIIPAAGTVSPA